MKNLKETYTTEIHKGVFSIIFMMVVLNLQGQDLAYVEKSKADEFTENIYAKEIKEIEVDRFHFLLKTADLKEKEGDFKGAVKDLNFYLDRKGQHYEVIDQRGVLYTKMKRYNKALNDFKKVIQLNPSFAEVYNHRGILNFSIGNYQLALVDYSRAVSLNNDYAKAYYNRALVKLVMGDEDGAKEDLIMAKKLNFDKADEIIKEYIKK